MTQTPEKPEAIEKRVVFLFGPIDAQKAERFLRDIKYLTEKDQKKPITLEIMSVGGGVPAGLVIIDAILNNEAPVNTRVVGMAGSLAALILAVGHTRSATKNACIVIHQGSSSACEGKFSQVAATFGQFKRYDKILYGYLASNTKLDVVTLKKLTQDDFFMTSKQALKYGFIDKIEDRKTKRSSNEKWWKSARGIK